MMSNWVAREVADPGSGDLVTCPLIGAGLDGGTALSVEYIEVRLLASRLRVGDRLIGDDGKPGELVTQVTTRAGEVKVSHPTGHTRLVGDPPLRVLRRKPRVEIDDDLPAPVWRPLGPRRTLPWEGDT